MSALIIVYESLINMSAAYIERARLIARRVHSLAEAAKMDAAIAVNLKELGYGV